MTGYHCNGVLLAVITAELLETCLSNEPISNSYLTLSAGTGFRWGTEIKKQSATVNSAPRDRKQIHARRFKAQLGLTGGETGCLSKRLHSGLISMVQAPVEQMIHQTAGGVTGMEIAENRPPTWDQSVMDPTLQAGNDQIGRASCRERV